MKRWLRISGIVFVWWAVVSVQGADATRVLTPREFHLGTPGFPEWSHFEDSTPHGRQLDLNFQGAANATEYTLFIRQQDVKYPWTVKLNGREVGRLSNMEAMLVSPFAVPPGTLKDGDNVLSIMPPKNTDDILVGEIVLAPKDAKDALSHAQVIVELIDEATGKPIPGRITIADSQGGLFPVHTAPEVTLPTGRGKLETTPRQKLAVRTGVVYTSDGQAQFGLRQGRYTIYGSRGFEWSAARKEIGIAPGEQHYVVLPVRREVDTKGWVAADTHIHNLTFSGHGDATIDEGMVTIAGEGIELAVATDHNHHTDYTEAAGKMKVSEHFTPVMGNEVTTKTGHFNAFPIAPGSSLPDHKLSDWTELMRNIRRTTGAKVIVLNHPRNVHSGFSPVSPEHYRALTGENLRGAPYSFDALEVVTSAALQSDLMDPIRDWFGMLNHGYRITGVGSSDTHYVSRMILGQGRSYVKADDSNPAGIDVAEAVKGFREGRVRVSMGLLVDLKIEDEFGLGDLAVKTGRRISVEIHVTGPSWVSADKLELFANGEKIHEQELETEAGKPVDLTIGKRLSRPHNDRWLVAVATGPGVTEPFWAIPRPYQPSSNTWTSRVIGLTNPVWLDADGDGEFTPPRKYASQLVEKHADDIDKLLRELRDYDRAVGLQTASLLHARGYDLKELISKLDGRRDQAAHEAFTEFSEALGNPKRH